MNLVLYTPKKSLETVQQNLNPLLGEIEDSNHSIEQTLKYQSRLVSLRTHFFKLQSFGRILRHSKVNGIEKAGHQLREASKAIEDAMGTLLFHLEMHRELLKTKEYLDQSTSITRDQIRKFCLEKTKFENQLSHIELSLGSIEKKNDDLDEHYLKGLKKEFKKIDKKVTHELDAQLLEDGTHKLRRLLRWIIMHVVYPKGFFKYKNIPNNESPSSYLQLNQLPGLKAHAIDYQILSEISNFVKVLGDNKDSGLLRFYKKSLTNLPTEINHSTPEIISLTSDILATLKSKNLILSVFDSIESP